MGNRSGKKRTTLEKRIARKRLDKLKKRQRRQQYARRCHIQTGYEDLHAVIYSHIVEFFNNKRNKQRPEYWRTRVHNDTSSWTTASTDSVAVFVGLQSALDVRRILFRDGNVIIQMNFWKLVKYPLVKGVAYKHVNTVDSIRELSDPDLFNKLDDDMNWAYNKYAQIEYPNEYSNGSDN